MSDKNFMSYTDAQSVLGGFANAIKGKDDPYTTITYSDWLNLTDQEKESGKYYITGAPGADGSIQVDLMTKLWENPDPSASFDAQSITLSSADYDMLMIQSNYGNENANLLVSNTVIVNKGDNGSISIGSYSTDGGAIGLLRKFETNGASVQFYECKGATGASAATVRNNRMIPYRIYGIKTTKTIRLNAIASDVSTSADKCMLSDGETSVEDVVECTQITAGNYRLRATVSAGGVVSYSWVAE